MLDDMTALIPPQGALPPELGAMMPMGMGMPPGAGPVPSGMSGMPGGYPSTDPMMLAQAAQDAMMQLMDMDSMQLQQGQQSAAMQANQIIDEMLAVQMQPPMPMPMVDPMMGFAQSAQMPMEPQLAPPMPGL